MLDWLHKVLGSRSNSLCRCSCSILQVELPAPTGICDLWSQGMVLFASDRSDWSALRQKATDLHTNWQGQTWSAYGPKRTVAVICRWPVVTGSRRIQIRW